MVRRYTPEGKKRAFRVSYWLGVIIIAVMWVWAFKSYFDRYEYLHPDITWAVPGVDRQIVTAPGLLLWKESILTAPAGGSPTFPLGKGPVRVARGAVVVKVGGREVKAYQQGYFVAGRDGEETHWRYSSIWPADREEYNREIKVKYIADGSPVGKGQFVGKIIEQPQELRFIGRMPQTGDIPAQIKRKRLRVRYDNDDTVSNAKLRVTMDDNGMTKFYASLPWFPPELVMSRNYTLIIDAGETEGAVVPRSAVLVKNGRTGVYMVRGARVVFVPVEGRDLPNDRFIVIKGISVGDAVVEEAAAAREGRIQLW